MADPKKPITAARRAQMAAASKRYRARKVAEKFGVEIPEHLKPQRPAAYRPPRKASIRQLGPKRAKTAARGGAARSAAERASDRSAAQREARDDIIAQLPQARNPRANIFVSRPLKRGPAASADAASIRRNAAAQKLQAAGRGLKRDFREGAAGGYAEARDRLSPDESSRFSELLGRLSKASQQTLAIYFHHEGGSGEFSQVIQGILYPPDGGSPSEALDRLQVVVEAVERGETLYGPKVVGRLDI